MRYGTSRPTAGPTVEVEVEVDSKHAEDVAIALVHIAREVFEFDDYMDGNEIGKEGGPTQAQWDDNQDTIAKHDCLRAAAKTFDGAVGAGGKVKVRLPLDAAAMLPDALMHVRKYVFGREGPVADALLDVVNSAEAAVAATSPTNGPRP